MNVQNSKFLYPSLNLRDKPFNLQIPPTIQDIFLFCLQVISWYYTTTILEEVL